MIGYGSHKNYIWQYFEVCKWARKRGLFSIFLHVHRNLGTKHKEATNRLGEDPFSPKDASSGKPGSLTVEPWWTRGGRGLGLEAEQVEGQARNFGAWRRKADEDPDSPEEKQAVAFRLIQVESLVLI